MARQPRSALVDQTDGHALKPRDPREDEPPPLVRADGIRNELTGIGTSERDKTRGGKGRGYALDFDVALLTGAECEDRWRGSDLGARVVQTVPSEMLREGWDLSVQLEEEEKRSDAAPPPMPAQQMAPQPPTFPPQPLEEPDREAVEVAEAIEKRCEELGLGDRLLEAMQYERCYGGGVVFIGADDGATDLTKPLDEERIKTIRHLTAFRGGWDGEVIAVEYYDDPREARYGEPEIYEVRRLGIPIAPRLRPVTPGRSLPITMPSFRVHESRLLVFPGTAVSRQARVQMRGWGDSVFTAIEDVMSHYGQTWGSVANLMQDFAQGVLKIEGLAAMLAKGEGKLADRMRAINLSKSIARTLLIDAKEDYGRATTPLTGISEVLQQFALRFAAAADMPVTLLFGQAPAGLNATGESDIRFFYDRISGKQRSKLKPQLHRFLRMLFLAKDSPTLGREPFKWSIDFCPLWQMTEGEWATIRKTQAETDQIYINTGVLRESEVAVSRFGRGKYSTDTIIDFEARAEEAKIAAAMPPPPPEPLIGSQSLQPDGDSSNGSGQPQ